MDYMTSVLISSVPLSAFSQHWVHPTNYRPLHWLQRPLALVLALVVLAPVAVQVGQLAFSASVFPFSF